MIGLGFCLALDPRALYVQLFWSVYVAGFIALYFIKSQAEEGELVRSLGQDYETYRSKVPVFLPIHGKVRGLGEQHFSAELYRRNREYQCLLGSAAILVLIFSKSWYGR